MKTYDEIKDIIVNRLGIKDLVAYKAWLDVQRGPPTAEDIELLSPDHVDNGAFWRVAEDLFQTDPVSNCTVGRDVPEKRSIAEANRINMTIYHNNGITSAFESMLIHYGPTSRPKVLEIGPGYGGFRDWLRYRWPGADYHAADCYPKIPEAVQTTPEGLLSVIPKAEPYHIVLASNVFQHLSHAQRRTYYADIASCLTDRGLFMVSQFYDNGANRSDRDSEGRVWCRHYGQYTLIQKRAEICADLQVHFEIDLEITQPYSGNLVYHCRKKPAEPVAPVTA